jgi:ketosteroid isomerase-like protein
MNRITFIAVLVSGALAVAGLAACNSAESTRRMEQGRALSPSEARSAKSTSMAERDILTVLDQLHIAAAKADESAYFDLYAPEAVFIGTDAAERWTKEEFRAYAKPYFDQGKGWTYTPRPGSRHVTIVPDTDGRVAFFEELLDNSKYGTCRGTGVVRKVRGRWLVSQYHLTFPVPNEMAERVRGEIRAWEGRGR